MRFWDSSAVVPLLVAEPRSDAMRVLLRIDPEAVVWWGTETECVSALARLERDGTTKRADVAAAFSRLSEIAAAWDEITASDELRRTARRLLRAHPLRAADALQLAAAVVASEGVPATLPFVTLDDRLVEAASREGFLVVPADAVT